MKCQNFVVVPNKRYSKWMTKSGRIIHIYYINYKFFCLYDRWVKLGAGMK